MKKLLAICLAVLLVCAAMPFAFATASEDPTIVVSSVEGKAGDTVDVTISLKNNPGLVSAKVQLGYDANVLELVEKTPGPDYPAGNFSYSQKLTNNPYFINFCNAIAEADYTSELWVTLTFKIKDDAAAGTYPFTLEYSCEDDFYNCFDKGEETVYFGDEVGALTVIGDEPVISGDPTIVIADVEGKAGDEISVPILLQNNPGLVSAKVQIGYDANVLELVDKTPGPDYPAGNFSYSQKLTNNPYFVNFCNAIAEADYTAELWVTLTFKIKDDAAAGTYPFTLEYSCEDDFYNCFDKGEETVYFGDEVGALTVIGAPVIPDAPEGAISFGHFETGDTHGWTSSSDISVVDGALQFNVTKDWGNIYNYLNVEPNTNYIVSFDAKGTLEKDLWVKFNNNWAADVAQETVSITTEWNHYTVTLNSGDLTSVVMLLQYAGYGADGQVILLDNLAVVKAAGCAHEYDAACDPECNLCGELRDVHTEGIIHFDAVEPGCHYNGNIEYWFCPECEGFWADEALTQLTNSKSVILPAVGGDVIAFEAIEPGCHYDGQIAYWYCPECEQFWQDEALTQLTNSKNVVLPAVGSENLQHVEAVAPTCNSEGNIEYWFCPDCEQYWQDEALTQLTNSKNVILGVTEHNIIHFDAVDPGCHYNGNIEYWFCSICEGFWQDEALTQLTNSKNVIVPAVGGDVIAFEAIEPGCHYDGQIAYWYCPECEQFWQDEALTQITNSKNVVLPAVGSENLQHVEAVAPTCQSEGNIEYWFCPDCEQYWQDEALTQLTNSKNVILGVAEHNIVHIDAVDPGCHYIGNIEYWYCTECEIFWQDEALTQITNSKNVIVPALGGDVIAFEAIEPGCHYDGQIAYWYCPECEQFWQDEALTQLTNSKNVVLPATGSENLQHVEAKDPTCLEAGNVEYWFCPDCEQYWQDAALTQLTNSKNVVIAPVDHTIVHFDAVEAGCHYNGNIEYWMCSVCEMFWADEALTQITNSKNVIVPALGGDVVAFEAIEPGCHYDGQIAYWYCPECEQFWQDEALTQLTNSKNVVLPATGSENLQHVEAKAPTATENGNIEYWYCADCEQYWQDEALTQLTNSKNVILPATGEVEPDSPVTGDSIVTVVVAVLALVASGVAVVLLKNKKRA